MIALEIDFPKYVADRLHAYEQRSRDSAAYAFSGELKTRRTIESSKPVAIAMEATSRLWLGNAKKELYEQCQKVTDKDHPQLCRAVAKACETLSLSPIPEVLLGEDNIPSSTTLGTLNEAVVVFKKSIVDKLNDKELLAFVAREISHIQNNHILFTTCLHYLQKNAVFFVRWIVQPALLALKTWSRKAEITSDRAALIAVKDLQTFVSMELKINGDDTSIASEMIKASNNIESAGLKELFKSHPSLPLRIAALKLFSESQYYLNLCGETKDNAADSMETDKKITELLSTF